MIIESINTVVAILLINNFMYNYFVGIDFFSDLKIKSKEDIALNLFFIIFISTTINNIVFYFLPSIMEITENFYLINILNIILAVLFINRIRHIEGRRIYYGTTAFLIWLLSYEKFTNIYISSVFILIMPFFMYLNLLFFEPLFEKLRIENKKGLVSYNVIFLLVVSIVSLVFNAFNGW
jgi:hypothetical protein